MASSDAVDRRALRFTLIFPVILAGAFAGAGYILGSQVPGGVVLPMGGNPLPLVTYLIVGAVTVIVVGAGIGTQAARTVLPRLTRRIIIGVTMALQLTLCALFAAAIVGQAGGFGQAPVRVDGTVLAAGGGFALAMGVILGMTFKPDEQWTSADDLALALEADPRAARDRLSYWTHPRSSVVIMILLAGLFPGALLALISPWFLLALFLLASAVVGFLCGTVQMNRAGLSVRIAGVIPAIVTPCTGVQGAVSLDVKARDYGGWGFHKHGGSATFLASSGAAVVIRCDDGTRVVVGAPNLDTADDLAAILNRRAGKSATG